MKTEENYWKVKKFQEDVLNWWKKNKRYFPWRETKDPYQLLVAEILLKRTTANQVSKVYVEFINKYPTPASLCSADTKELEKLLKPLGMNKTRAKLLKKFACAYTSLIEKKKSKFSRSELLNLPGVGEYTANAVLALIYNECVPMLDTNFIRILERIFGIKSQKKRPKDDPFIWEKAKEILPCKEAKNFNLAVLDFSALICKYKNPNCMECFAQQYCLHRKSLTNFIK